MKKMYVIPVTKVYGFEYRKKSQKCICMALEYGKSITEKDNRKIIPGANNPNYK